MEKSKLPVLGLQEQVLSMQYDRQIENLRPEIAASWARSLKEGLNAKKLLPHPNRQLAQQCYQVNFSVRQKTTSAELLAYTEYLNGIGAVLFSLDNQCLIFNERGDEKLINVLKQVNICTGSILSESNVGVTAASLSTEAGKVEHVIGTEHYLECLTEYVTIAERIQRDDDWTPGIYLQIIPKANYSPIQKIPLTQLANLLKLTWVANNFSLVNHHFQRFYEQNETGFILVDTKGNVFKVNRVISKLGLCPENPGFQPLIKLFPELSDALECLKNGKPINDMEITFLRPEIGPLTFYLYCQTLPEKGMSIVLKTKKEIKRTVVRIGNYCAYYTEQDLIGSSDAFLKAKAMVSVAASSDSTVLITGESGTGKELFAQAIHNASDRKSNAFVSINCAAIPRELINSELFGYEPGAFTGANKNGAMGKVELADGGTLFLDEIAEMPLDMQTVLLRMLEERCIQRLGGKYPVPVNVRIIAATNKNLQEAVDKRQFRLDLYFRLKVLHISIPPLRERQSDIKRLANVFLEKNRENATKQITAFQPEAMQLLEQYGWPGNVRELRNTVESSYVVCSSDVIGTQDLPQEIIENIQLMGASWHDTSNYSGHGIQFPLIQGREDVYWEHEKRHILDLMARFNGNKTKVAKELHITRATLYKKLRKIETENLS